MFRRGQEAKKTVTAQVGAEGALVVTLNGEARTAVPRKVAKAWVMQNGESVLYSYREMKRGFEGEGEALFRYEIDGGKHNRILTEDVMIDKVYELATTGGNTVLCVTMSDGGLGANYIALVDPKRGVVYRRHFARFAKIEPNVIVVAEWNRDTLWGDQGPTGKPTGYLTFNPDRILKKRAVADRPWRG